MPEEKLASRWLVSTDWLSQHLDDPNVVILDSSYYLANAKLLAHARELSPESVRMLLTGYADQNAAVAAVNPATNSLRFIVILLCRRLSCI